MLFNLVSPKLKELWEENSMISSRPYLLRAFYEWIVDNHLTPYLVVNAEWPGVRVPQEFVENGRIILNINPEAILGLKMTNKMVTFNAQFGGVPFDIEVPVRAAAAIYAKENGKGMVFKDDEEDEDEDDMPPSGSGASSASAGKRGGKRSS